jgi:hypothetical protein
MTDTPRDHAGYIGQCGRCGHDLYNDDKPRRSDFPDEHWVCRDCDQDEADRHRAWVKGNAIAWKPGMDYREWLADQARRNP